MSRTKIWWFQILCGLFVVFHGVCVNAVTVMGVSDEVDRDARSYCGYYVKPATCMSHSECKWVGSCVPR
jgi:hypothetical protein